MAKKAYLVIDIKSNEIYCFAVASDLKNGKADVKSSVSASYAGYKNGEFIDQSSLEDVLIDSIAKIRQEIKDDFSTVYVGLPAEFSYIKLTTLTKCFAEPTVINDEIICAMFDKREVPVAENNYFELSETAIKFSVDGGKAIFDPIGKKAKNSLEICASYCYADVRYTRLLTKIIGDDKLFGKIVFIPTPYATSLGLFTQDDRKEPILLANIERGTSSITHILGEGLLAQQYFSSGKEDIVESVASELKLSLAEAERLVGNANLATHYEDDDAIYVNKKLVFRSIDVADLLLSQIEHFARMISIAISRMEGVNSFATLYLTGDGLLSIAGARVALAKFLHREVIPLSPDTEGFDHPKFSSAIGLITEADILEKDRARSKIHVY